MSVLYPIETSNFYKLCLRVFQEVRFPLRFSNFSKLMYGNFTHVFLLVLKERLNVSYRRFVQIADEMRLQRMLCIRKIPHFTTLQKFMQRIEKGILEKMVRACRKLLKLADLEASIDGTGFSNTNPSHYYAKRIDGKIPGNFTSTILLADNCSKLVLNIRTQSDRSAETRSFIPLVKDLRKALSCVLADKGYDSMDNRRYCWSENIDVHIPVRKCREKRTGEGYKPCYSKQRRIAVEKFDAVKYKRRSLIESINSAIKRTLGGYVNSRTAENQQKQVTVKALAYNLEVVGRTIKLALFIFA